MAVKPPRPSGPPLNSLRAFESAARQNSFTKAADELYVTAGAIAQQIKNLENWADGKLFERLPNGVVLTPLGETIQKDLTAAFDLIGEATQKLRTSSKSNEIRIAALPSIAQLWIAPLLPKIRILDPQARVSVTASEQPPNLLRELFDISVFFGTSLEDGTPLLRDEIFPVCSPDYAEQLVRSPQTQPTLIHDSTWRDDWALWLSQSDELDIAELNGPVFSLYSLAIEETINNGGLLMGHAVLVKDLIDCGKLVKPFQTQIQMDHYSRNPR